MNQQYIHWLYGLSAPMVALNSAYGASFVLPSFYSDDEFVDLKDSWNIRTRQELLDTIFRMTEDGHAEALAEGYFLRGRMLQSEWQEYCENKNEYQQVLLNYIAGTSALCGSGGIRSWDIARMSFLARIGVLDKFITEQESLWLHFRLALRARYYYSSWQTYCAGYLFGRCYWQNLDIDEPTLLHCALSQKGLANSGLMKVLTEHQNSPLVCLPWYIDFEEIEKPDSLKEIDWS